MTQTIGLKAPTKYGDICIVFPLLKETEKAILIRVPQIAGSGCDIFATGREKEVWIPKSQMKEAGNGYYLKPWIWEKIAPDTALTTAAWVMTQIGADLETTGYPGEMLGEVASKVREAYPEPVFSVFLPGDRVRLTHNPDMVGEVVYVSVDGRHVSVQFPGPGQVKVCAIDEVRGVTSSHPSNFENGPSSE